MGRMKSRIWEFLEPAKPGDTAGRAFDIFMLCLIFLNVIAFVVGTVHAVRVRWGRVLHVFEIVSVLVFSLEYVGRLWTCTASKAFAAPIKGRLRFIRRPMSVVDLLSVLPFYLPFLGVDFRVLRALRLFRIIRVVKVGRYYSSLQLIGKVFRQKKEELVLTTCLMMLLLLLSASTMYYCEHDAQPNAFSSIPATFWWAVSTLTTVGYGDVYPITPIGKLMGSVIAILGIGMFAFPPASSAPASSR